MFITPELPIIMKFIFLTLLSLVSIFLLFHFLTKKYINPYKLYLFFGKKGAENLLYFRSLLPTIQSVGTLAIVTLVTLFLKMLLQFTLKIFPNLLLLFVTLKKRILLFASIISSILTLILISKRCAAVFCSAPCCCFC